MMKFRVGSKHAARRSYHALVGATVTDDSKCDSWTRFVRSASGDLWNVHIDDLHPIDPIHNQEALYLLKGESL